MSKKPRLVTYKTLFMPISNVVKTNFYASSQFCDNTRDVANELKTLYLSGGRKNVPDQFAYVEYYRDANPTDDPENGEDYVICGKFVLTETATVDAFVVVNALGERMPKDAEYCIIAEWRNALLTLLYFALD
jgi:hypothetical protein